MVALGYKCFTSINLKISFGGEKKELLTKK
jgi:hypothetical protein